ncbi:MAG: TlpA disulfide reductase family protein [Pseudomonadota bacterium]
MMPLSAAAAAQRRRWPKQRTTPALELSTLDGAAWRLSAQRGRVVALNFWASWCEPCRTEMPSLELLAQRHERDGLTVMAINHKESVAAIRRFSEREALSLPVLRDADGLAARACGVGIFPTTVLIGRDGRAAFSVVGEADWQAPAERQWINELL